jgi:hypothetical protein
MMGAEASDHDGALERGRSLIEADFADPGHRRLMAEMMRICGASVGAEVTREQVEQWLAEVS